MIEQFVFNDFRENTYVLWDETLECVIVDPGCYYPKECDDLQKFISGKNLKPVLLLNTHCHIDHIFGNKLMCDLYHIPLLAHHDDLFLLNAMLSTAGLYGIKVEASPEPNQFLNEGEAVRFGNSHLQVLFTPGHSPGSVSFYSSDEAFILSGDVLFQDSVGRVDLPGGDYETLMQSIFNKLLTLPDSVSVFSGHGPVTTIGEERRHNPFVLEYKDALKA